MLSLNLRKRVVEYIDHAIEIDELENWYVERLPILLADPNSSDAELVSSIELGLAELSAEILDEEALRAFLVEALQHVTIFEEISITEEPQTPDDNTYSIRTGAVTDTASSSSYQHVTDELFLGAFVSL